MRPTIAICKLWVYTRGIGRAILPRAPPWTRHCQITPSPPPPPRWATVILTLGKRVTTPTKGGFHHGTWIRLGIWAILAPLTQPSSRTSTRWERCSNLRELAWIILRWTGITAVKCPSPRVSPSTALQELSFMTAASSDQSRPMFSLCFTFSFNPMRRCLPPWPQDGLKRIRTQTKDRQRLDLGL